MFDDEVDAEAGAVLARLSAALDELATLALCSRADSEVLALWRGVETCRRRMAVVDHALICEVQRRHLEFVCGASSVTVLARQVLRIDSRQAHARVKAAEALGPRVALTGEALGPIYAGIAAAQARGSVGEVAARVIIDMIERLPERVRAEQDLHVEDFLVAQAEQLDVDCLRTIAQRLSATLDPDGLFKDLAYRDKHRELNLTRRPDGSGHLEGELTAELTEHVLTVLDCLARPAPAADGTNDDAPQARGAPRSAGQRRHDALLDALRLLERAQVLPRCAGVATTVVLTMSAQAWATGDGTACTGHGTLIPAGEAIRWAGGDTRIIGVVLNSMKRVEAYSSTHRIYTEGQRLAMIARDQGCSFPGCDAPPLWTEAHHITDHAITGHTTISDGTLLCRHHHRQHAAMGYSCVLLDGVPHWIAPTWLDPTQTPRRNHMHHSTLR